MRHPGNIPLGVAILLLWTSACFAELADRDKPLNLESDQVLMTEQASTFTGNVRLSQGTMLIRGDKVVVIQDKNGYKKGTVYGHLASFRQKREGMDEYMEGYGERIEYDTAIDTVDFFTQARVLFGADEVSGEHITYNISTEIFQVSGGSNPEGAATRRVRAVLQPKHKAGTKSPGMAIITPGKSIPPAE